MPQDVNSSQVGPTVRPPDHTRRKRSVVRVEPQMGRLSFWILSSRVYGLTTHWIDSHSVICTEPFRRCRINHAEHRPSWQGWLALQRGASAQTEFVALTPGSTEMCNQLLDQTKDLRGMQLILWRMGNHMRGTLGAALGERIGSPTALKKAPPMARWLESLYSLAPNSLADEAPDDIVDLGELEEWEKAKKQGGGK